MKSFSNIKIINGVVILLGILNIFITTEIFAEEKTDVKNDSDAALKQLTLELENLKESQSQLNDEIVVLKTRLVGTGVVVDGPLPELTPEQKKLKIKLQAELKSVDESIFKLEEAEKNGVDPELLKVSKQDFQNKKKSLEKKIELVVPIEKEKSKWEQVSVEVDDMKKHVDKHEQDLTGQKKKVDQELKQANRQLGDLTNLIPIDMYAFGDFYYVFRKDAPDNFEIGQLEMDLEMPLHETVTVAAAIAYNADSGSFGVGAFTIDGGIAGNGDNYFFKTKKIEAFGFMFGQFDVPFGIAYLEYPSIDHRFVSSPLAVDETHDSWNDLGGQFYLDAGYLNVVAFGTNGIGYSVKDDNGDLTYINATMALGGRVGVPLFEHLELGGSVAALFNTDFKSDAVLAGGDLNLEVAGLQLKGEYIYKKTGLQNNNGISNQGFYAQGMYDFDPFYIIARYSEVFQKNENTVKQLSGGLGIKVIENGEIRFELTSDLDGGVTSFIQMAGGMGFRPTGLKR
ncbi:MAG: hypothetical protein JXR91_01495 [Deltaproteobacteria bacterium]|nr:hypothetical protein [Deltaproteobacteria bacterium]